MKTKFVLPLFAVFLCAFSTLASATEWLYSDSVQPHWNTTNSYDVSMNPSAVYPTPHSGSHDLQAVYTASWGAVHFDNVNGGYVGQTGDNIIVWFYDYDTNHSTLSSDVEVTLFDTNGNIIGTADFRDGYASSLQTMQWNEIEVPLSDLDAEGETIGAVELESENLLIMYFDDVHFTGGTGGGGGGGGGSCTEAQSLVSGRMGMTQNDTVCLNTSGPSLWFFGDQEASETELWYWNVTNDPNTPVSSPVYEGTKAIKAHFQPGVNETGDAGLQFHSDVNFDPDPDTQSVVFVLRGNISPSNLMVSLVDGSSGGGNPIGNAVSVDDYTAGCSPTGGWCTIQIPMSALISFSPANHLSGFTLESTQGGTEYLDEVRVVGVGFMEFPIHGNIPSGQGYAYGGEAYTPYTAPISSVFDHTFVTKFTTNGVVVAYDGEMGDYQGNPNDGTCIDQQGGAAFTLNGNYVGAASCGGKYYLSYDGHPGIDYPVAMETPVYATADGVITEADCPQKSTGESCAGINGGFGKLIILHDNGYQTIFNHLRYTADGISQGDRVVAGELVGYSGETSPPNQPVGPHLHVSVKNPDGEYVDPYGWQGSGSDPYTNAVNYNLWRPQL